jgi:hypothetical protein
VKNNGKLYGFQESSKMLKNGGFYHNFLASEIFPLFFKFFTKNFQVLAFSENHTISHYFYNKKSYFRENFLKAQKLKFHEQKKKRGDLPE